MLLSQTHLTPKSAGKKQKKKRKENQRIKKKQNKRKWTYPMNPSVDRKKKKKRDTHLLFFPPALLSTASGHSGSECGLFSWDHVCGWFRIIAPCTVLSCCEALRFHYGCCLDGRTSYVQPDPMVIIRTASGPDRAHQPVLPLVCWSQQRRCKGQLTRYRTACVAQAAAQLGLRNACALYPMGSVLPLSSFLPWLWCISFRFCTFTIPWIVFNPRWFFSFIFLPVAPLVGS